MYIQAFMHCKTCSENGDKEHLEIGAVDPQTLGIYCATCDTPVGSFKLAQPLPAMKCSCCGEDVGPNHIH